MSMHFDVWVQGGPVGDHHITTFVEPPLTIFMWQHPATGNWVRVTSDWKADGAVAYERVPSVEQFDNERIYYPVTPPAPAAEEPGQR